VDEEPEVDEDEDEVKAEPKRGGKRATRAKTSKSSDDDKPVDMTTQIKRTLLENDLYMPLDELFDILSEANQNVGVSKNTLSGIAAGLRNTMKLLDKLGMLKEPLKRASR
jgi:hypothetical protein